MSRRRYVSTTISRDVRVNRLAEVAGDFAAMLYTWMIPHAADDGSLPTDPEELMFMVIPGRRDKSPDDVRAALNAMRAQGLILWDDDGLRFPATAFYRYQTYIQEGKRRGANPRETPQNAPISANQRKSAQNASSVKPSPSPSPSFNPSGGESARARANGTNGHQAHPPPRTIGKLIAFPEVFELRDEDVDWIKQQHMPIAWVKNRTESFVMQFGTSHDLKSIEGWYDRWRKWLLDDWTREKKLASATR